MKVLQVIAAIVVSSFIGVVSNPEMMSASDSVALRTVDMSRATYTEEPVKVAETGVAFDYVAETEPLIYTQPMQIAQPAVIEAPAVTVIPSDNIRIGGNTVELGFTNTTAENAGSATYGWYLDTGHFIYAHNYPYVFGHLDALYDNGGLVSLPFSVTMNGVTNNYTVVSAEVKTKIDLTFEMSSLIGGAGHRMVLMTCYGNDSRLVIYAD
ncbi:hypothetical protein IJ117_01470 [Candidatus Saccharibacteria bacterium]|nr:hypothetical protein [Candidatus Saccharibacteria bacterium]